MYDGASDDAVEFIIDLIAASDDSSSTDYILVDNINFPDDNFRAYIDDNYARTYNGERVLFPSDVADITDLDARYYDGPVGNYKGIELLTDLEDFISAYVDIGPELTGIDFSNNKKLNSITIYLYDRSSNFSGITLGSLPNLVDLALQNTSFISYPDISECPSLEYVMFSDDDTVDSLPAFTEQQKSNILTLDLTNLSQVPNSEYDILPDFVNLYELCLRGINIDEVPDLSLYPDLINLYLENLNVGEFDISAYTQLKRISLENVNVINFDTKLYPNVRTFILKGINVSTALDFNDNVKLRELIVERIDNYGDLDFSSCPELTDLTIVMLDNLDTLDLSTVTSITSLELINLSNLTNLNLDYLTNLDRLYFYDVPLLTTVSIAYSPLRSMYVDSDFSEDFERVIVGGWEGLDPIFDAWDGTQYRDPSYYFGPEYEPMY